MARGGRAEAARSWRHEAAAVATALGDRPPVTVEIDANGGWCHIAEIGEGLWTGSPVGGRAASCRPDALPLASASVGALAVSFVGHGRVADERRGLLAEARRVLVHGGTLLLLDHNRPRRLAAALAALAGGPRVPGGAPAARWRRLSYPTARETQTAGFRVVRLKLVWGERLQLVVARR